MLTRRNTKIAIVTTMSTIATVNALRYALAKSNFGALKNWSILNGFALSGLTQWSNTRRVTTRAVNIEMQTPAVRVIAKPRTGPVPTTNRMTPVMIVVRLESRIAVKARP